jgi:hypothetical protein
MSQEVRYNFLTALLFSWHRVNDHALSGTGRAVWGNLLRERPADRGHLGRGRICQGISLKKLGAAWQA